MRCDLRHDRSPLLYPTLDEIRIRERRERCVSIVSLRGARRAYHLLSDCGMFADACCAQLCWKLRELGVSIGVRLVISGVLEEGRGLAELN